MPDFLLANFANFLNVKENYGSIMEVQEERFTGRTLGPFPLGQGKIRALETIISGNYRYELFIKTPNLNSANTTVETEWQGITFYADHWLDRFLLEKVGNPVVVNPKPKLFKLARSNGWPVEIFN